MSGRQFCKRHSSWFCPCVASWLYSAAAKAAYEENVKPRKLSEAAALEEKRWGALPLGEEPRS